MVAVEIQVDGGIGTTVNFSAGGVYFKTAQPLRPQEQISVIFPFQYAAPGTQAAVSACVLRVDELGGSYSVAAAFESIVLEVPATH